MRLSPSMNPTQEAQALARAYKLKYKMRLIYIMALATALVSSFKAEAQGVYKLKEKEVEIGRWIDSAFDKNKLPPFSFLINGVSSSEFIRSWKWERIENPVEEGSYISKSFFWKEPGNGLIVRCDVKGYPEDKAAEWTLHFLNKSSANSGQISGLKTADIKIIFNKKGPIKLHYAEGNKISRADYAPRTAVLEKDSPLSFSPVGGRSSEEAFPFYNIESENSGQGIMAAIGWSGTWFSKFNKIEPSSLEFSAGMAEMDLHLLPGEEIRTPSVVFLFWKGKKMDGHNAFRRFVLKHHSRKINGQTPKNLLSSGFNYRDPQPFGEYSCITSEWACAMIDRYNRFGLNPDIFWLDAGWHTGADDYKNGHNWASTTGNWTIDKKRFPQGMKPVSDAAHKAGAKFMLWFEPERVVKGTEWAEKHKKWMLDYPHPAGAEEADWLLFDLGNDEACEWLCKYYGDMIEENGIDYYRQDCNIKPALYWKHNDEPLRRGMKEIRHVENLYRFWDYLMGRFPELIIDNCASGGKRLDWETVGRSVPLWRSDYYHYDDPDGYQCHTYGLSYFLPVHGTGILLSDSYSFRSSLSSSLIFNWKITEKEGSIIEMRQRLEEYKEIRDYYYEDYYPLSGEGELTGHDVWLAYQMHRPSDGSGIIVAFRREKSQEDSCIVFPSGIEPDKNYIIEDSDTAEKKTIKGRDLQKGWTLSLDKPKTSLLLKYRVYE